MELYNRSETIVELRNSLFGDSLEQSLITDEELNLSPGDYLILCEDISQFISFYPEANCIIKEPSSWHTLNNSGDRLILKDSLGFIIDQVSYTAQADIKGVSQERVSPEKPSSEEDNWWRSVDPNGSTPCEQNSLHKSDSSEEINLETSPKPFSPDGDGFEDQTKISYTIPFRSELTLKIFDVRGRLVKTLMEKEPQVSGEVFWQGDDDKGKIVRAGIYILYLKTSGSSNLSQKTTIVVAKR